MSSKHRTAIITGASQGIGAGVVRTFLDRGYSVVANARNMTTSRAFEPSARLALVDGDVRDPRTAEDLVAAAVGRFGSIDALVYSAGIFFARPFLDYTTEDVGSLFATNVQGFIHVSQRAIERMLAQGSGGSIVSISSSLVEHPMAGMNASVPMITKGGLEALTRSLAMEYAKDGIRVNAVAPGQVATPMHANDDLDRLRSLQPMGQISTVRDIADAILYLTEAAQVTGEVLHVDGGAHAGRW